MESSKMTQLKEEVKLKVNSSKYLCVDIILF